MQTTKKVPTFKVGDKIKFEVGRGTNHSRWNYDNASNIDLDFGESNIWAIGEVIEVTEWYSKNGLPTKNKTQIEKDKNNWISVKFTIPDMIGTGYTYFPTVNSKFYDPNQWTRPGFLQLEQIITCECGGEKCKTTHSHWCPKFLK